MEIEIKFPSKNEKYNLTNEILEKDYVVKLSYFQKGKFYTFQY